jgi:hypothetical protein
VTAVVGLVVGADRFKRSMLANPAVAVTGTDDGSGPAEHLLTLDRWPIRRTQDITTGGDA